MFSERETAAELPWAADCCPPCVVSCGLGGGGGCVGAGDGSVADEDQGRHARHHPARHQRHFLLHRKRHLRQSQVPGAPSQSIEPRANTYTAKVCIAQGPFSVVPRARFANKRSQFHPAAAAALQVRASYLQIYNEVISDLLKPERTNLHIREEKRRGIFVEGLSEWVVRSSAEIYGLMQVGRRRHLYEPHAPRV
jgi:hypothetical protein